MDRTLLIADSGSTKTDWLCIDGSGTRAEVHTDGINPARDARDIIYNVVSRQLLPSLPKDAQPEVAYFYGAGCIAPFSQTVKDVLVQLLPGCTVWVESDLLGAARALCQQEPGIACILGTGSNSCYYDGSHIAAHTPPLGYILGDEGSGTALGKALLNGIFKDTLAHDLREDFDREYKLSLPDVIARVYRQPAANTFLASLVPFIAKHRDHPDIHDMLLRAFRQFFVRNVVAYRQRHLAVHCLGGIAYQFQEELSQAATALGMHIGRIMHRPIDHLALFHTRNCQI